jgi:hypothetical protein
MRAGVAAIAAASALGAAGCEATFHATEPFAVGYEQEGLLVRAQVVPSNIWAYPHVYYGGTYAYLVDGVWYYPTPNGWMVFRREPVELSRERTQLGQGRFRMPYHGYPR